MRRSIRALLGLAAATAVIGVAAPTALTAPANATAAKTTLDPQDWGDYNYSRDWGFYHSRNHKAKAKGHIDVTYTDKYVNTVVITGQVYDKDSRLEKCGRVGFRWLGFEDGRDNFANDLDHGYHYWQCSPEGSADEYYEWPTPLKVSNVAQLQVRVCQVNYSDLYDGDKMEHPYKCSGWRDLYNAYKKRHVPHEV